MSNEQNFSPLQEVDLFLENMSKDSKHQAILLRRKLNRILKTIQVLTEKKIALDIEIRRQRAALLSRRNELKKVRSNTTIKASLKSEGYTGEPSLKLEFEDALERSDSILLAETAKYLENF